MVFLFPANCSPSLTNPAPTLPRHSSCSKSLPVPLRPSPAPRVLPPPSFLTLVSAGLLLSHHPHFSYTLLAVQCFLSFFSTFPEAPPCGGSTGASWNQLCPTWVSPSPSEAVLQLTTPGPSTVVPQSHSTYFRTS